MSGDVRGMGWATRRVSRVLLHGVAYPCYRLYASWGAETLRSICGDPTMQRIVTHSEDRLLVWSGMMADLAFEQLARERFDVAAVLAASSADACRGGSDRFAPHLARALYYLGVSQARMGEPALDVLVESADVFERNLHYRGMHEMHARTLATLAAAVRGDPLPPFGAVPANEAGGVFELLLTLCREQEVEHRYAEAAPIATAAVHLARAQGEDLQLARALERLGHCHLHAAGPAIAELAESAELATRHLPGHVAEHVGSEAHGLLSYALSQAGRHEEAVEAARKGVDLADDLRADDQRTALARLRDALVAAGRDEEVPPIEAEIDALTAEDTR